MERIRRFFSRLGKTIGKKGYTLLEVAAVVAVTGTLAAVAMPVVADKIADGKSLGAQQDVQAIRDAVICFMKDTGVPPIYGGAASNVSLPKEADAEYYVIQTDDGKSPVFIANTYWVDAAAKARGSIDEQLIKNTPQYPTSGDSAWKGPYLPSVKRDPWGNKYLVTVKWFAEDPSASGSKVQKAVYVISAGPNGIIETSFYQRVKDLKANTPTSYAFTIAGDDIVSRIQ